MKNQYEIMIHIGVLCDVELTEFQDKFIDWIESNDWLCGGGIYYSDDECNDKVRDSENLENRIIARQVERARREVDSYSHEEVIDMLFGSQTCACLGCDGEDCACCEHY